VVVGRQRVKHTLEANKLLLKEGKTPLLVPESLSAGLQIKWPKWSAKTKSADLIHH
jgi:hypothetical protein